MFIAKNFYKSQIGVLLLDNPKLGVAAVFYLIFIAGIVIFAVMTGLRHGQWYTAMLFGALFGWMCYGTYDLTNLATLKGWTLKVAVIDIVWGTFLTGTASTGGYFAVKWFFPTV